MKMEKTKTELYMDRLEKWRKEKEIKLNNNKKRGENFNFKPAGAMKKIEEKKRLTETNKRVPFNSSSKSIASLPKSALPKDVIIRRPLSKPAIPKDAVKCRPVSETYKKTIERNKKNCVCSNFSEETKRKRLCFYPLGPYLQSTKRESGSCSEVAEQSKQLLPPPSSSKKQRENSYIEKFRHWQDEKGKSEVKLNQGTNQCKRPTEKVKARSRLFDFQEKIKQDKENKSVIKRTETAGCKTTEKVSAVKRRHSVSNTGTASKRKPAGILKRKSCVGSLDWKIGHETELAGEVVVYNDVMPVTPRNVRFMSPESETNGTTRTKKRRDLNNWLASNNRTPSKFRHLLCFEDHEKDPVKDMLAKCSLTVDELTEQANVLEIERLNAEAVQKLNTMLEECMTLFEAGCPPVAILPWLDDIYKNIPQSRTSVKFYKCKIDVLKESLDLDAVLQVFEQATINDAQPKTELARILTETLKLITEEKIKLAKKSVRTKNRSEVQDENVFMSSAIVYAIGNATPVSDRKRPSESRRKSECKVVTPVRRSTRRSLQNLPDSLKDNRTLTSLDELTNRDNVLYQPNLALENNNIGNTEND